MIHNIKLIAVLALITFGAGQTMARGADLGSIKIGTVTGGTLTFYKEAACKNQISINNNLSSSDLTDGKVYIKATPSFSYTGLGVTFTANKSGGSDAAQARNRATDVPFNSIQVTPVNDCPGVYCFEMPADGMNVNIRATFPDKQYLTEVSYIDPTKTGDEQNATTPTGTRVYILDGTETRLDAGWYICNTAATENGGKGLSYTSTLQLYGDVHLILADNCKMTVETTSDMAISSISNIAIYGQSTGDNAGSLIANANNYGINASGNITISGGQVIATGTNHSGICSGAGKISITDCNVTATGGSYGIYASGIITISGEKVEAIATGTNGNGINTGASKITITDGEVIATGGSNGIKGGAEIIINKGKVTATGTSGSGIESVGPSNISITDCEVNAEGGSNGIKSGSYGVTINGGKVTATGTNGSGIESVGPSNISITNCEVNAEGGSNGIKGYANITINGGKVTATGTSGSGIESGDASNISITNCEVNAEGGSNGIKSGSYGVTINGGKVTATGTSGSGIESVGPSNISITNCEVNAEGGSNGIKGSNGVTISGGQVVANYTGSNGYGIYSGINGITLGWTNATDYICANSYATNYNGPVKTTEGQRFVAYNMANESDISATAIVSGSSTDATPTFTLDDINGKTLRPINGYCVATENSHVTFDGKTKPDFSIGGKYYYIYEEAAVVKLGSGEEGVNIDVSDLPDGTTYDASKNTFIMPGDDMTITLSRYMASVDYMDWDATDAQLVKKNTGSDSNTANDKVYILEGYEKKIGQDKEETWYICNTPASNNSGKGLEYSSATIRDFAGILLEGNVHLILANGSKMSVSDEDNVSGSATIDGHAGGSTIQGQSVAIGGFTIHGQGGTTEGILDVISTNSVQNAKGISYSYDDINICGGNINIVAHATGDICEAFGIYAEFCDLNIYGGTVNVRSWDDKSAESCGLIACYDDEHGGGNVNILGGTVNVITSDNAYTENTTTYAIYAKVGNVTISNATVTTFGVYANEVNGNTTLVTSSPPRYGIYAVSGELDGCGKVIITGNANIDAGGETGIGAEKLVQINSGTVSATRISSAGDIEINGGQVDSHTTIINMERVDSYETIDPNNTGSGLHYLGDAIHADGSIILGWTAATDYVRAYRISTGPAVGEDPAVVKTADGKRFVAYHVDDSDTDNPVETPVAYLAGNTTLTDAELANINDPVCYKVFRPIAGAVLTVPDNVSVVGKTADFSITTGEDEQAVTTHYYLYNATAQSPVTVTASYDGTDFVKLEGLPEGTTLDAVENQPLQRSFAMTNEDVPLTTTVVTGLTASGDTYDYDGTAKTPTVKLGDDVFAATNYIVAYTKGGSAVSEAKKVGTYSCTVNGSGSYIGTIATDVAITINPKTVTVTGGISASNKTYDGTTTATLSGTNTIISGKVDGDALSVSATGAFADKNAGTGKTVNINMSSITLTGNDKDNYVLASTGNQATTSANISKKDLSITADDKNVSYGDPAPNYTASYSGFVSGESESNLSGSLSFSCSYMSSSNTGTYSIMPSGYTSSNYNISYHNGTLTVTEADIDYTGGSITLDENGYDITLDEGTGSANPLPSGFIHDLDYSRTLTAPGTGEGDVKIGGEAANLYTVCLPTAPITGTAVTYYTLSGVEGNTLKFIEIDGSPAEFTPYLVAVKGSSNFTESCNDVSFYTEHDISGTTVDGFTFTGTLTGLSNADAIAAASSGNVTYILQNAAIWGKVVSGSVYLPPFRAYIVGPVPAAGARELSSSFDDSNATAIERIVTTDRDGTEHWYDMNGRRIEKPTTKGVYILNGRKEVIK